MTRDEFIKILEKKGYSYSVDGDYLIIPDTKGMENVLLDYIKTLPPNIRFINSGWVDLTELKTLPDGVYFNNNGDVILDSIKVVPSGVEFNNKGNISLDSVKKIKPGAVFNNGGHVDMESIVGGYGYFHTWDGNIDGIASNRLLNGMIKRGLFL